MAVKALQAKQVQRIILTRPAVEAGERLGFLPGDLMAKIDPYLRPLYDALYDMVDARGRAEAARAPDGRGGAAGVHARPHAQQQLHHPRRGAEHDARADEDVPHPHRLRLQGRGHRRRHPGRRPERQERPGRAGAAAHRHRRPGVRPARPGRRRAPPDRRRHRRGLRAQPATREPTPGERIDDRAVESRPPSPSRRRRRRPGGVRRRRAADVDVDVDRWRGLADAVLHAEGARRWS